jgi:hypothetical protein
LIGTNAHRLSISSSPGSTSTAWPASTSTNCRGSASANLPLKYWMVSSVSTPSENASIMSAMSGLISIR